LKPVAVHKGKGFRFDVYHGGNEVARDPKPLADFASRGCPWAEATQRFAGGSKRKRLFVGDDRRRRTWPAKTGGERWRGWRDGGCGMSDGGCGNVGWRMLDCERRIDGAGTRVEGVGEPGHRGRGGRSWRRGRRYQRDQARGRPSRGPGAFHGVEGRGCGGVGRAAAAGGRSSGLKPLGVGKGARRTAGVAGGEAASTLAYARSSASSFSMVPVAWGWSTSIRRAGRGVTGDVFQRGHPGAVRTRS